MYIKKACLTYSAKKFYSSAFIEKCNITCNIYVRHEKFISNNISSNFIETICVFFNSSCQFCSLHQFRNRIYNKILQIPNLQQKKKKIQFTSKIIHMSTNNVCSTVITLSRAENKKKYVFHLQFFIYHFLFFIFPFFFF